MLYSYLLTKSEFRIDDAPEAASRDKRFAYSVYIDLLLLIMELSGYSAKHSFTPKRLSVDFKLGLNKVAKALCENSEIRAAIAKDTNHIADFDDILQGLHDKIVLTPVYADYKKKSRHDIADDVDLWITLLETTIANDDDVIAVLRTHRDEFTVQGFEQGIKQAVSTLRSYSDFKALYAKAKKDLVASLDKAYELYLTMFALIIDITNEQERRLENAKSKYLASSADKNPNMALVNNKLVSYLRDNESLNTLMDEYHVMHSEPGTPMVKAMLDKILASQIYADYIEAGVHTLKADTEFWRDVLKTIILPSDQLDEELEDKSVYWNDDIVTMGTFVLKTLRHIAQSEGKPVTMLPKYKDIEDERFGPELFTKAVENQDLYRSYIDKFIVTSHWDPKRLAFMDIVIITAAIAEIINFPSIPVPVSVNEYVEIAQHYSTEKSGNFINGILYPIINYLREEGIVNKN